MNIDKKALLQLYGKEKQSVREIGLLLGKSPTQISRYLAKFQITARPFSTKGLQPWLGKHHTEDTKAKLRKQHLGKKLSPAHRAKVIKTLSSYKDQTGDKNPSWKGGRTYNSEGYIWIKLPQHPNCNKQGYYQEHRLVMEKYIGRYLIKGEFVHHKNGIRDDNRIENLELMNTIRHNGRTKCPYCHKEFLIH